MATPSGPFSVAWTNREGRRVRYRYWTAEEWSRLAEGERPAGAIPFGAGWAELSYPDPPPAESGAAPAWCPHRGSGGSGATGSQG